MPGGRQPGAGRPVGARSRQTIEREQRTKAYQSQAETDGLLPLDVMLEGMRNAYRRGDIEAAEVFARDAAPYIHARLASTETKLQSENVHRVVSEKPLSMDEWQEMASQMQSHANDAVSASDIEEPDEKAVGT